MSQRGITADMVDMALAYGTADPRHIDRTILGHRLAVRLIEEKQRQVQAKERELRKQKDELRVLKKLADKGGIVVVEDDSTLITTYNLAD
jgi:hypothetical protein